MCGIAGVLYFDHGRKVQRENLGRMAAALVHRGPDDEGYYLSGALGFAHRRLSIIDLAGGKQPLSNEDETVWMVCNGEIFNYRELTYDLQQKGHRLRTQSDCEVIVHLYEEYGEKFVEKLRGQFAFAIWDEKEKRLILGRDHTGEKPLYVYRDQEKLIFASEIKGILAFGPLNLTLSFEHLGHFLTLGYFPHPHTHLREVKKLPAAHCMVVQDGQLRIPRYWEMPRPTDGRDPRTFSDVAEDLHEKLLEAVNIRLMSDVPLGAFLSGGVDSSLIVSLMAESMSQPVKTFNISFDDVAYDESDYARRAAIALHTEHRQIPVTFHAKDLIEKVLRHFDEPFADSSALAQYVVSHAAKQHVTVALSGDAGDEFFGGYRRFLARKIAQYFLKMPEVVRRSLAAGFGGSAASTNDPLAKGVPAMLSRFLRLAHYYEINPQSSCLPFFELQTQRDLLGDDLWSRQDPENPLAVFFGQEPVGSADQAVARMMYTDQNSYLTDDILVKVDRMSMVHALEVRSPLLDCRLIEWAAKLPLDLKIHGRQTKYALKKMAEKKLPHDLIHRPKQGFAVPINRWFREELKDLVNGELLDPSWNLLNRQTIERILTEHQRGQRDWAQQIWALLALKYTFHQGKS